MALKVFDLQCEHNHVFEGWFGSANSYDAQQAQGLLSCPVCNSTAITKKLSAPRLNVSHIRAEATRPKTSGAGSAVAAPAAAQMAKLQAEVLRQIREVLRSTEDVGVRFAEEALRIHEGEAQERPIRGTATSDEREALAKEGIAVMPIPDFLDDDRMQ